MAVRGVAVAMSEHRTLAVRIPDAMATGVARQRVRRGSGSVDYASAAHRGGSRRSHSYRYLRGGSGCHRRSHDDSTRIVANDRELAVQLRTDAKAVGDVCADTDIGVQLQGVLVRKVLFADAEIDGTTIRSRSYATTIPASVRMPAGSPSSPIPLSRARYSSCSPYLIAN